MWQVQFQICWHIDCRTLTMSSFRIWNSSAGIPSSPLALFIIMFPEAHLTSQSRMLGSRWIITPSWLSRTLRLFCIVHLCILPTSSSSILLLFCPYHFCPLLCPFLHEIFPWYLIFRLDLNPINANISLHCSCIKSYSSLNNLMR